MHFETFWESLIDFNFTTVASSDDPDQCYKIFCDSICKHFNNFFPKTNLPLKPNRPKSPWFDKDLKRRLYKKDKLYKRYIFRKDEASKDTYREYINTDRIFLLNTEIFISTVLPIKRKFILQKNSQSSTRNMELH